MPFTTEHTIPTCTLTVHGVTAGSHVTQSHKALSCANVPSGSCAIRCRHGNMPLPWIHARTSFEVQSDRPCVQYIHYEIARERIEPCGSFVVDARPLPLAVGNAVDRNRNRCLPPRLSPLIAGYAHCASHLPATPPGSATQHPRPPSGRDTPQASMHRHCKRPQNLLVSMVDADRQYLRSDEGARPATV